MSSLSHCRRQTYQKLQSAKPWGDDQPVIKIWLTHSLTAIRPFHYLECWVLHSDGWLIFGRHLPEFFNERLQLGIVIFLQSELELIKIESSKIPTLRWKRNAVTAKRSCPSTTFLWTMCISRGNLLWLIVCSESQWKCSCVGLYSPLRFAPLSSPTPSCSSSLNCSSYNKIDDQPQPWPPDGNIYHAVTVVYDVILLQLKPIWKNMKLLIFFMYNLKIVLKLQWFLQFSKNWFIKVDVNGWLPMSITFLKASMFNSVRMISGLQLYWVVFGPVFRANFPSVAPGKLCSLKYARLENVALRLNLLLSPWGCCKADSGGKKWRQPGRLKKSSLLVFSMFICTNTAGSTLDCCRLKSWGEEAMIDRPGRRSTPITINCEYQHVSCLLSHSRERKIY